MNVARWPTRMRPISASSIEVSTCMSRKLRAITNSSGDCRLAATVWPASIERLITTPSTGARIAVRSRSTRACCSCASRCATTACALPVRACATSTWARALRSSSTAESITARALSSSAPEMKLRSTSCCLRARSRRASARLTDTRETAALAALTPAWALSTWARAASTSACAWRTRYSKVSGSMRAISWPLRTSALKSANSSLICPETWEPTGTVTSALSVPVADTLAVIGPRVSWAVRHWGAAASCWRRFHSQAPAASRPATTSAATQRQRRSNEGVGSGNRVSRRAQGRAQAAGRKASTQG